MIEKLKIKRYSEKRISTGHLWIFSNELESIPKLEPGTIVEVIDSRNNSFGFGFYNPNSLISVRLLQTQKAIDHSFFLDRIKKALEFRRTLFSDSQMYRLVFGESDYLPGLVIDKYGDYLSMQVLSAGMERNKELIIQALTELLPQTKGIIEKNNSKLREIEGLSVGEEIVFGDIPDEIKVSENDIRLSVSIKSGQKTGYFLDQRENRLFLRRISKDKKVLDCYSNQGGFALNAAFGGASESVCVDVSSSALKSAKENASLNGFSNMSFIEADVPDFLASEISNNNKYDIIVLDPPAFAKNKKSVPTAKAGYTKINKLALQLINTGDYLVTSSCSQHIREELFLETIQKAGKSSGKELVMIYRGMQSPDHPILLSMPETQYLKFFVFKVV